MSQTSPSSPAEDQRGFSSSEQRLAAIALVEQCSQFKGVGEALAGRSVRAWEGSSVTFEPGWVSLPVASLRDLPAGPMGRLGMALMGAAAELSRSEARGALAPAARLAPSPAAAPSGRGGNSAWLDEEPGESAAGPRPQAPRPRRAFAQEGEGEDSFAYLVRRLEDEGFGGTSVETVAANRAKAQAHSRKRF